MGQDTGQITIAAFQRANVARCNAVFRRLDMSPRSFYAMALAGEVGELCNVLKKLEDGRTDVPPGALESEFGDVLPYLVLLAERCGVDLETVTVAKFNEVSARRGYAVTLPAREVATESAEQDRGQPPPWAMKVREYLDDWQSYDGPASDDAVAGMWRIHDSLVEAAITKGRVQGRREAAYHMQARAEAWPLNAEWHGGPLHGAVKYNVDAYAASVLREAAPHDEEKTACEEWLERMHAGAGSSRSEASSAGAEPDPTDYEATAAEVLRDPVARAAYEANERARAAAAPHGWPARVPNGDVEWARNLQVRLSKGEDCGCAAPAGALEVLLDIIDGRLPWPAPPLPAGRPAPVAAPSVDSMAVAVHKLGQAISMRLAGEDGWEGCLRRALDEIAPGDHHEGPADPLRAAADWCETKNLAAMDARDATPPLAKGRRAWHDAQAYAYRAVRDHLRAASTPRAEYHAQGNPPSAVLDAVRKAYPNAAWKTKAAEWLRKSDEADDAARKAFALDNDDDERAWAHIDDVLAALADTLDPLRPHDVGLPEPAPVEADKRERLRRAVACIKAEHEAACLGGPIETCEQCRGRLASIRATLGDPANVARWLTSWGAAQDDPSPGDGGHPPGWEARMAADSPARYALDGHLYDDDDEQDGPRSSEVGMLPEPQRMPNDLERGLMRTVAEDTAKFEAIGAALDVEIGRLSAPGMLTNAAARAFLKSIRRILAAQLEPQPTTSAPDWPAVVRSLLDTAESMILHDHGNMADPDVYEAACPFCGNATNAGTREPHEPDCAGEAARRMLAGAPSAREREAWEDDAALVRRAVSGCGGRPGRLPRWSHVRGVFGLGSGSATKLCRRLGLDPDEIVGQAEVEPEDAGDVEALTCPKCSSTDALVGDKDGNALCLGCGHEWTPEGNGHA